MKRILLVGVLLLLGVGLVVGLWLVGKYNTLVTMNEDVDNAQAQVETQLQRRYDLIPNLVESVRGAQDQEEDVFSAIADARTRYGNSAPGSEERVEAANELEGALSRLLVVVENYPELRSNQTVISLMDELAGTENRISVERRRYNDKVTDYNKFVVRVPNNLIAGLFGFDQRPLFEAVADADVPPTVDLAD